MENKDGKDGFVRRLQARLTARGLTGTQLADALNLSRQQIGHWLSGRNYPGPAVLVKVAEYLDTDPNWLKHGAGTSLREPTQEECRQFYLDPILELFGDAYPEVERYCRMLILAAENKDIGLTLRTLESFCGRLTCIAESMRDPS